MDVFERIDFMAKFSSIIIDMDFKLDEFKKTNFNQTENIKQSQERLNDLETIYRKMYKIWDEKAVQSNVNSHLTSINLGLMFENQELKKEIEKLKLVINANI